MAVSVRFNRKQFIIDLASAEPVLKKDAIAAARTQVFEPAVAKMLEEFNDHKVTQEIRGGIEASNISQTLEAPFGVPKKDEEEANFSPPNLTAFIGFPADGTDPTEEIEKRLTPNTRGDGPVLEYKGLDKQTLTFRLVVHAPSKDAIYGATPMPWTNGAGVGGGVSWAQRIEMGIPGIGFFLNALGKKGSRSGGGIQVENQLRSGRYRPVSYLSGILRNFLTRISGREPDSSS